MSRAHILVVEDDKNVAAGLRDIFSVQGYTVWIAENNRDALSILQTETVDLTMLDVSLGADSGYDLCRDIRRFSDMGAALEKSQSCMNRLTDEIDKILKSS